LKKDRNENIIFMANYKHLFFDLDRTLWDFESNSIDTFRDIFAKHQLDKIFPDFDTFITVYKRNNEELWAKYRTGEIKKETLRTDRFLLTLKEFGVDDINLAQKIGDDYITISPTKSRVFPHTHDVLDYLKQKGYKMHIITNGFNEVQFIKLRNCDLEKYFDNVITSENAGYQKPRKEVFHYAVSSVNAKKDTCLMIGDDPDTDMLGAKNYGMDQVFFNTCKSNISFNPTYSIDCLSELRDLL